MGMDKCVYCGQCDSGDKIMLILNNVKLPITQDFSDIKNLLSDSFSINKREIISAYLYKKSIDARHKNNIVFVCSFLLELRNEAAFLKRHKNAAFYNEKEYEYKKINSPVRPVVVGFGPAGMFAALFLARFGLKPIILERGKCVEERKKDVDAFLSGGPLDENSNIQFGEGGAGTFSDGKLNTGIKDSRIRTVLKTFYDAGAAQNILYDAKPHIGTDVLIGVVRNIRKEIIELGGEFHFSARFDSLKVSNGAITGVEYTLLQSGEKRQIDCSFLVLAIGHSARDTFVSLLDTGVQMVSKPFSVGARIEHKAENINRALYGDFADVLPSADYKMAVHLSSGRGVYTFCMCPGGYVINASSEKGGSLVNGMSEAARNGENSNCALLVEVHPEDLDSENVLSGMEFQRSIEQKAYNIGKGNIPVTTVGKLLNTEAKTNVTPTVKPGAVEADIYDVLPDFVVDSIKEALPLFAQKIEGFADGGAVLTFPESRSTSPVRIIRGEDFEAIGIKGLFPAGEGAGYAGGIMSSAVDGIKIAEAVRDKINLL